MRVAHFDCFSGISGDMTLAALFDLGVDVEAVRAGIDSLGLPIQLEAEKVKRGGFAATYVKVIAPEETSHRFLPEIEEIFQRSGLPPKSRDLALKIFRRLAEAEAAVHGQPLERVHFHEVGALDSIADIAGSALALDLLGVEKFSSGPVPPGGGTVKCAHGLMPVPTPATARLLQGVPLRKSPVQSELVTPTGAAILTTIVTEWLDGPQLTIERIGHGAGRREFPEHPNLLRIFVGQTEASAERDRVWMLETNLDDLPAEVIGYCYEQLLSAGALDVFSAPIFMKKNRPGVLLSVLAPESAVPTLEAILFRETTTFGIRRYAVERSKLNRRAVSVSTPWGPIQGKLGWRDGQPAVFSPEYEDCARVARQHQVALREVFAAAHRAYQEVPLAINLEHSMSESRPPEPAVTQGAPTAMSSTQDDRMMALIAHMGGIVAWFVAPLIVWLIKKDQSPFVDDQAKEALNFQINVLVLTVLLLPLSCFTFGFANLALWVYTVIMSILGGMAANQGQLYRYPATVRIIK